jgi:phospholipase/carboxylesterase
VSTPESDDVADDLVEVVTPLLGSLEALGFIGRHFHPGELAALLAAAGGREAALREALPRLERWPGRVSGLAALLRVAAEEVLAAFEELGQAAEAGAEIRQAYRALRHGPRAQEALYGLASGLPPVNRFFLSPPLRGEAALQARLLGLEAGEGTGPMHVENDPGFRGGFSLYVPEDYGPQRAWPLVVALHGGSGHGRSFLWTWLRDARSLGAVLVTPTSIGSTWGLHDPEADTDRIAAILDFVRGRWRIDPGRLLLTGMSDGGTFSYLAGLEAGSPFTHLAPISASFHPMLAAMADRTRLAGLPIFLAHGALDWMFPVASAREAAMSLSRAGASVRFEEVGDLSHAYPSELNLEILRWLMAG